MRMTEQRRVIARVLAEAVDHPDVEELYRRCVAVDDKISISTVYRTVKLFEDAGIIERHDFREGRARYEQMPDSHHDHLINLRDGKVIEFTSEEIEKLQAEIARKLGYKLVDHRLELYCVPLDDEKTLAFANRLIVTSISSSSIATACWSTARSISCRVARRGADASRLSDHAPSRCIERFLGRSARRGDASRSKPNSAARCPTTYNVQSKAEHRSRSFAAIAAKPMPHIHEALDADRRSAICVASSGTPKRIRASLDRDRAVRSLRAAHLFRRRRSQRGKPAPDLFLFAGRTDERRAGTLPRDRGQRRRRHRRPWPPE